MNVKFTDRQEKYISAQSSSGDFQNASEVVHDTLQLHMSYRNRVLEELHGEIAKGWEGPASKRSVKDIINDKN